jgi:protein-L-isoaspartate(D-aspartate) O-methyltransferase
MISLQRDMISDIEAEVRYTQRLTGRKSLDPRVMRAIAAVPRERFVPDNLRSMAFENGPLPIGHGQTISQPYIVALMTDLLEPAAGHRILEIGTGSGYQAAVLSHLCERVYSVERVGELAEAAAARLQALGYDNVEVRVSDGYAGWPEHAPYDGIIVTAAAPYIPPALTGQLRPGGHLVIPVGRRYGRQELLRVTKDADGALHEKAILGVAFVPLVDANAEDQS